MNNMDFQKLLDDEKWDEAIREAYGFWEGSPRRRQRIIISLLIKLLKEKEGT
jgi:hypothetical protein